MLLSQNLSKPKQIIHAAQIVQWEEGQRSRRCRTTRAIVQPAHQGMWMSRTCVPLHLSCTGARAFGSSVADKRTTWILQRFNVTVSDVFLPACWTGMCCNGWVRQERLREWAWAVHRCFPVVCVEHICHVCRLYGLVWFFATFVFSLSNTVQLKPWLVVGSCGFATTRVIRVKSLNYSISKDLCAWQRACQLPRVYVVLKWGRPVAHKRSGVGL